MQHTSIGEGQRDYKQVLQFSRDFSIFRFYNFNKARIAYNFREDDPENQLSYSFETGIFPINFFSVAVYIGRVDTPGGKDPGDPGSNFLNLNIEYTNIGGKFTFYFLRYFLIAFKISKTIVGKNTVLFFNSGVHLGYYNKIEI